MVTYGSKIKAMDNTGARICKVIGLMAATRRRGRSVGEQIKVSVGRKIKPRKKVKRKEIHTMIITRVKKKIKRDNYYYLKFDSQNAGVILKMKGFFGKTLPLGTRIFGPIAREIRELGFKKIVSLASFAL